MERPLSGHKEALILCSPPTVLSPASPGWRLSRARLVGTTRGESALFFRTLGAATACLSDPALLARRYTNVSNLGACLTSKVRFRIL